MHKKYITRSICVFFAVYITITVCSCSGLRHGFYNYSDSTIALSLSLRKDNTFTGNLPYAHGLYYSTGKYIIRKDTLYLISKPASYFLYPHGYNMENYIKQQPNDCIVSGHLSICIVYDPGSDYRLYREKKPTEYIKNWEFKYYDENMQPNDIEPIDYRYTEKTEYKLDTLQFILPIDIQRRGYLTIERKRCLLQEKLTIELDSLHSSNIFIDYYEGIVSDYEFLDFTGSKFLIKGGKLIPINIEDTSLNIKMKRKNIKDNIIDRL